MKLSILICTLANRTTFRERLMRVLNPQLTSEVEVLMEEDSGERTIGWKRNRLLERATGDYVCFVDDDDLVSGDYVSSLLYGIERNVDAVCIQGIYNHDGGPKWPFHDKPYQQHGMRRLQGKEEFTRGLQHLDAIKREIASSVKFPDSSFTEDYEWGTALEATKQVQTWHLIDHPIYFYEYREKEKRSPKSLGLVIIMPMLNHVYLTKRTIDSLIENTEDPNFILLLIDDGTTDPDIRLLVRDVAKRMGSHRFHFLTTTDGRRGVNPAWNVGIMAAEARGAEYIAIVNNDVLFGPKWDTPLLGSLQDPTVGVVSPLSTYGGDEPFDWPRGEGRDVNPAGYRGYMPILGCCFMARASTFRLVGPFPEKPRIYFGDNWLAVAVQNAGLECGYDNESYVHHMFCQTTVSLDNSAIWDVESAQFEEACKGYKPLVPFAPEEVMA